MNIAHRPFAALLKRELWEHRAFWFVPVIISCVLTLMGLYQLTFGRIIDRIDTEKVAARIDEIGAQPMADVVSTVSSLYLGMGAVFSIGLGFALAFYLLDALYADRRDRSFLFWKSMPVSDVQTVLSKLAMATVVAPLISLGVVAVTAMVWSSIFSAFALWTGAQHWAIALNPLAHLDFLATAVAAILVVGIIFLPLTGYLLLVSAWAKRAPFLWAVLPPLAVAWIEEFTFDSNHFIEGVARQFGELTEMAFDHSERAVQIGGGGENVRMRMSMIDISVDPGVLLEPRLWLGLVIAAGFIAAAIWVRRFRDEA